MARAAAPASGALAMSWRRPASPARSAALWANGAADFVHDPGAALHEDLWADPWAIGDGFGRAVRMGGEEPARSPGGRPWRAVRGRRPLSRMCIVVLRASRRALRA